eukprot:Plantae.Rhodophyta-Hildenbrandia_rubra.ctg17727.p1 GENE.Plantae.Rhodophyta-Hildenbrandia_rubra.ctg17727~~Plantae.Rhodophyta-Hildenbrandia_rubra.ctg17727.p1  ORF type:complete len:949 (-),score=133.82 Plantae.Rhodophyta-Hildenbrandia_rubra.ctg17727:1408-4254(-)
MIRSSGLDLTTGYRTPRFNPQLLAEGEVLLVDVLVDASFSPECKPVSGCSPVETRFLERQCSDGLMRGRLRIGTSNMYFDADDWRSPIIRVSYRDLVEAYSDDKVDSFWICLNVERLVYMKERGFDHPYIESKCSKGLFKVCGIYSSIEESLDLIVTLKLYVDAKAYAKIGELVNELGEKQVKELQSSGIDSCSILHTGLRVVRIWKLAETPGIAAIESDHICFTPLYAGEVGSLKIRLEYVRDVRGMRCAMDERGLEICGSEYMEGTQHKSGAINLFLVFSTTAKKDDFWRALLCSVVNATPSEKSKHLSDWQNKSTMAPLDSLARVSAGIVSAWRSGLLSNFGYLMKVNIAAGRSFQDLSQYPVFPWVIADYESQYLDFTTEHVFRGLRMPLGAINPDRLRILRERYEEMPPPKFLYGTHYSAPGYIISYLVRANPGAMLKFHGGKFDTADRLFHSIPETWRQVSGLSTTDVKELIPEFYAVDSTEWSSSCISEFQAGEFLVNSSHLDLGVRSDGVQVSDVALPPWANGSASNFVKEMRRALESDHVSRMLPEWIDLVFGCNIGSADSNNIYYTDVVCEMPLTSDEKQTILRQFGCTPRKIFKAPHPRRVPESLPVLSLSMRTNADILYDAKPIDQDNPPRIACFEKKDDQLAVVTASEKVVWKKQNENESFQASVSKHITTCCIGSKPSRIYLGTNEGSVMVFGSEQSYMSNVQAYRRAHDGAIIFMTHGHPGLITAGSDGFVRLWKTEEAAALTRPLLSLIFEVDTESPVVACDAAEVSNGFFVVAGMKNGRVSVWFLRSDVRKASADLVSEPIFAVKCDAPPSSVAFRVTEETTFEQACVKSVFAIFAGKLRLWHPRSLIDIMSEGGEKSWNENLSAVVSVGDHTLVSCDKHLIEMDDIGTLVQKLCVEEVVGKLGRDKNGIWAQIGEGKIVLWRLQEGTKAN